MNHQTRIPAGVFPNTWIGRLLAVLITAGLVVIGLFFLAFALIAAAVVAAAVLARIWWVSRKLRAQQDVGVIEGSYTVEVDQTQASRSENTASGTLPPAPK